MNQADAGNNTVLAVGCGTDVLQALRFALFPPEYQLVTARTCWDVMDSLERERPAVVITESRLPDGDWKDVLRLIASLQPATQLIVTHRHADECLWAEV